MLERVTKRVILGAIAQLFDPLGFLCPATIVPKILLQPVWVAALGWDEEVDTETID